MTEPFDLTGPLPSGTCVLEASAGTGKTYAITALAVRFVAEGHVRLDQVMMVTFSRAATGELRHRVHARLRTSLGALDAWLADRTVPSDAVDAHLVDAPEQEVVARRDRIREALAEIDAATIATTHEFCQRMLTTLGLLVDHDQGTRFAENVDDLASQVVNDVYLAHEVAAGNEAMPGKLATFARYAEVGHAALREPDAPLVPVEATGLSADRIAFATEVRHRFEARKRRAGVYTFDDMVRRLRDALFDPVTGPAAVEALSQRYPLVLIDEFQDTDPTQWQIVRRAFVGRSTVVLIGDPKQAIYAFRGADVHAYLDAVREGGQVWTLQRNHRSDPGVVRGILDVFAGSALGSPEIVVREVEPARDGARLRAPQGDPPPVQVRCLQGEGRPMLAGTAARAVDADLANQVVGMLADGWQVQDDHGRWRPLLPSDIAVLVRSNRRGERVKQALEGAGVSAVFGGAATVMSSEAAQAWLHLLRALAEPANQTMKRAALTPLLGWDEVELAEAVRAEHGTAMADLAVQVKTLSRLLHQQGVSAVFEALCDQTALYRRLLGRPDGERLMTDVRHVAQLLNEAALRGQLGPAALVEWLEDRIADARRSQDDDRTRRLETDASCVQVMTIHGAKGLEFPVVMLPQAADEWLPEPRQGRPTVMHLDGQRVVDVGVDAAWEQRLLQHQAQERGEALRTLYVAMTRAKSRLVMWWAPTKENTEAAPLHRLLHGDRRPGTEPPASCPLPPDPTSVAGLDPEHVELVTVAAQQPRSWQSDQQADHGLLARRFGRTIDQTWRRTSYSALTAEVHGQRMAAPAEPGDEVDEVELPDEGSARPNNTQTCPVDTANTVDDGLGLVSALAELPGGTQFGSLVHGVLEVVDATSTTLRDDLAREVAHQAARLPVAGLDADQLVEGLLQVLETPLGDLDVRLGDVSPADRLAELDFELPMGAEQGSATLGELAQALQDGSLTGEDAFAAHYGAHLAASPVQAKTLRGFLTGSIDVVLRTTDDAGRPRFVVLDYKTNRMPVAEGERLDVGHYRREPMEQAMIEAHYPLQALLYAVALHRFLTWRLPGYSPQQHLGGIGYLFVRGMAGAETPAVAGTTCGVFTWHPAPELVVRLSDLLGGRR